MIINKIKTSKLEGLNLNELTFGKTMSDHMLICEYENGKWGEPKIIPYGPLNYSPAVMAFHYGQAIFEGMKAYKDKNNDVFLFRPEKNFERFNKSANRMAMPQISKEIYLDGLKALIDIDRNWVSSEEGQSLYVRPVMYASEEMLSARISNKFTFSILSSPANSYYSKPLKVKIETKYTRAVDGGVGFTKCAGNYGGAFYPTRLAEEEGFGQVIWTDSREHLYFEESGTMNLFVRIGNTLYTPPVSTTVLSGVTRDSLINISKFLGIDVKEERISVKDILDSHKENKLMEVFGCGTAVVVSPFVEISYEGQNIVLPKLKDEDNYSLKLKKFLVSLQRNEIEDPFNWRVKVNKNN